MSEHAKDYYQILGIGQAAQPCEIQAAFRALANKFHPDVFSPEGPRQDAELRFRQINEAHEVLSDPERRRQYDQLRWRSLRRVSRGSPSPVAPGFSARPARHGPPGFRAAGGATGTALELSLTPEEARSGGDCEILLTTQQRCPACLGTGSHGEMTCRDCQGTGTGRTKRRLRINLPRQLCDGEVVRIAGKGKSHSGLPAGDLYLRIRVRPHG